MRDNTKQSLTLMDFLHDDGESNAECEAECGDECDPKRKREKKGLNEDGIFTVTEITRYIKQRLAEDENLIDVRVRGEISNLRRPSSGNIFFTMKDEGAKLRCVMFRAQAELLRLSLKDGMNVIVRGRISVYEREGKYQLYVESVEEAGIGELFTALERLKRKLHAEGLFDESRKKPIPQFPQRICIITSPTGAAIRDMLNILRRRYPHVHVFVVPVMVQGDGAHIQIANAIELVNRIDIGIDVLIVGRGGGSFEELRAFNEEVVARAIYKSEIPVISAVGHEIDRTIADLVADKRAATPSEAAEIVVPDVKEVIERLKSHNRMLKRFMSDVISERRQKLRDIAERLRMRSPLDIIYQHRQTVDMLKARLKDAISHIIAKKCSELQAISSELNALSPLSVIERGYCICRKEGNVVRSVTDVDVGDELSILINDGELLVSVVSKQPLGEGRGLRIREAEDS